MAGLQPLHDPRNTLRMDALLEMPCLAAISRSLSPLAVTSTEGDVWPAALPFFSWVCNSELYVNSEHIKAFGSTFINDTNTLVAQHSRELHETPAVFWNGSCPYMPSRTDVTPQERMAN